VYASLSLVEQGLISLLGKWSILIGLVKVSRLVLF